MAAKYIQDKMYKNPMNGTTVALGLAAAVSILMIGLAVFRDGSLTTSSTTQLASYNFRDRSNLEEDLNDILAFIPLDDVKQIINNYATHDKQISETIKFINDMNNYITKEFRKLPNIDLFINILRQSGLHIEYWQDEIRKFWKNIPQYINKDTNGSYGGLTAMISTIMEKIPKEELHALIRSKVHHSESFRRFLQILASQEFIEFYGGIKKSRDIQRLFYWATEADIEIIFAVELLTYLHSYLKNEYHNGTCVG